MQVRSIATVGVAATVLLGFQAQAVWGEVPPNRISVRQFGFEVVRPSGWYAFGGAELPSFFNFPAEKAGPQGEFPSGGASIRILVRDRGDGSGELRKWAEAEVASHRGTNAGPREVTVTTATGAVPGVRVDFDQLAVSREGPAIHFVFLTWEFGRYLVGAELSYDKADRLSARDERALLELIHSFRPI